MWSVVEFFDDNSVEVVVGLLAKQKIHALGRKKIHSEKDQTKLN